MSDRQGNQRATRSAAQGQAQNNDGGSQNQNNNNNNGSEPNPAPRAQVSADLGFMPMRVYQRRVRARAIMERILAASPRFAVLSANDQNRIREATEEAIRENIVDFMENSAPRALYPYEAAVLNAVRMTIQWNPDICDYDEDEWQSGLAEEGQNE